MSRGLGPQVSFFGVRGSTPCSSETHRRYGGNTSCVIVERDGHAPVILDMGTGIREFGAVWGPKNAIEASILVTHLHWDHVQGLPFFGPVHNPTSQMQIFGPPHKGNDLADCFKGLMQPPYFPICCDELPDGIRFNSAWNESFAVDDAKISVRGVPHTSETNGYRVDMDGYIVVYIPDHQQPAHDSTWVDPGVLELCDGADLLIHDAQFTPAELEARPDWGHCTPAYALEVAVQSGAKRLCMFHHDPWHDDDQLDELHAECTELALESNVEVMSAAEGMQISLGG